MVSEAKSANKISDFTGKISLSKNQMLGNLLAVLVMKQNPREHKKVPNKKYPNQ